MRWPWSRSAEPAQLPAPADEQSVKIAKAAGPESFTTNATVPGPTKPAGADGVAVTGGFLVSGERDARLTGRNKWVTYDNATLNVAIISAAVNVWTQLAGSAKWTAEPNKRGGAKAQKAADIVTQGLFEAQMSIPWRQVVRRQVMKKFRGFSLHEGVIRRRSDGMVVYADLGDRPQWTVYRWDIPDDRTPWQGVEQLTQFGDTYYIPRERLFYSVENTLSSSPDGVGLLRQMAEHVRVLELYQQWEGIGFHTDLRGVPIAKAPLTKLRQLVDPSGTKSQAEVQAGVQAATKFLTDFLRAHNKRADQGIMLDSATFPDNLGNPTGNLQWAFDLIKGASSSMPEVNTAIGRITREIARVMQAEWLMLGGEDSGGAYSMHEDKTAMFALIVNSTLEDIADDATRDLATRLTALNGLDPETCTPKCVPEPIATGAVTTATQALMNMFQAALDPRDPAINILRARLNLPPAPTVDEKEWILPRGAEVDPVGPDGLPIQQGTQPPAPGGPPKPGGPPGPSGPQSPGGAPRPGGPQGQAGNPNARPEAAQQAPQKRADVEKYAPEQPRDEGGRWTSGGGGMSGGVRPWTLAFDDREHQKTIDQHRRTEADHRAKANALKDRIADARAHGDSAAKIKRLIAQRDEHRAAATAAREAKQAAQRHMEAARAEHTAGRRAAAAERSDAEWDRARAEADSFLTIGRHSIGTGVGADEAPAAPARHEIEQPRHISEAETAANMERASADLQRQSDAMRADRERADLHERLGVGRTVSNYDPRNADARQVVSYEQPKRTQAEWNLHDQLSRDSQRTSDDRAGARNSNLSAEERQRNAEAHRQAHAQSEMRRAGRDLPDGEFTPIPERRQELPDARVHQGGWMSRLRSVFGRKRALPEIPVGLDAAQIAKMYADAMEDQRLDQEAALDEIEATEERVDKYDADQPRDDHGRFGSGGSAGERIRLAQENTVGPRTPERDAEVERQERAAMANEQAAITAGHLADVPHAKLDAYMATRAATQQRVADIRSGLDAHHALVAQALADLHAHDSEGQLSETRGLAEDHFGSTSRQLGAIQGDDSAPDFVRTSAHEPVGDAPEPPTHPGADADEEALDAHNDRMEEHQQDLAEHAAASDAEKQAFGEHAERAQSALEALHGEQVKAAGGLRDAERKHDQAARSARREAEVDPEDLVNGEAVEDNREHEQRAKSAAESLVNYESNRRDELTSGLSTPFEDAHGALKDETRQTVAAIRELSKITGRAPNIGRPGKKG